MSLIKPKARLVVVLTDPTPKPSKFNYSELLYSMLLKYKRKFVDLEYLIERANSVKSSEFVDKFLIHRGVFKDPITTTYLEGCEIMSLFVSLYRDLKIYLDENKDSVVVIEGASFIEEFYGHLNKSTGMNEKMKNAIASDFVREFGKLFSEIPTLLIEHSDYPLEIEETSFMEAVRRSFTYVEKTACSRSSLTRTTATYDLFDHGQGVKK